MRLDYPPGATPPSHEEQEQLIPPLQTQGELNEFEARNIAQAIDWSRRNPSLRRDLLTPGGLCRLHREMFGETWRWAGRYRERDANIGKPWHQIGQQVAQLCGDARYWVDNLTWPWPELAVRFHHRLVSIHPFPNGNGRHARLAADLLLEFNGQPVLPWGKCRLDRSGAQRDEYIAGLREADEGCFDRLLAFAASEGAGSP